MLPFKYKYRKCEEIIFRNASTRKMNFYLRVHLKHEKLDFGGYYENDMSMNAGNMTKDLGNIHEIDEDLFEKKSMSSSSEGEKIDNAEAGFYFDSKPLEYATLNPQFALDGLWDKVFEN